MAINIYKRCTVCDYAQYLANGEVGCYEPTPICCRVISLAQKLDKEAEQELKESNNNEK